MPTPDRVNLPVGLFPGAGVALTPQEKAALDRQEFLAYQRHEREKAIAEREESSNRVRNGIFDFMERRVGAGPEWSGRTASVITDWMPGFDDAAGAEDTYQSAKAGDWKGTAVSGLATGIGIVPLVGTPLSKGVKAIARGADDVVDVVRHADDIAPPPAARLLADDAAAIGHNGGPALTADDLYPRLTDEQSRALGIRVLEERAKEMDLKPANRALPDPSMLQLDLTPEGYRRGMPEQSTIATPARLPPETPYPKRDRVRPFIDRKEEIAQRLAENMRAGLGSEAEYFYHTNPVAEGLEKAGVPSAEARQMLNKVGSYSAATSPRTKTHDNTRSASMALWKHKLGIPLDETVGPVKTHMVKDKATGKMVEKELLGEKGYPMMISGPDAPGGEGTHYRRLEELRTGQGIDMLQNTKPYTFEENWHGNLQGVTVDTHAIRGAVKTLNDIEPGAVPPTWLKAKYRAGYAADPSSLDVATMIDDKLEADDVLGQTEYGPLSDLYARAAEILGVDPAVAQSLGWFGSGEATGLGSAPKSAARLIDERVAVTAAKLGMDPKEVLVRSSRGEMPLLSIGGIGVLPFLNQMTKDDEEKAKAGKGST